MTEHIIEENPHFVWWTGKPKVFDIEVHVHSGEVVMDADMKECEGRHICKCGFDCDDVLKEFINEAKYFRLDFKKEFRFAPSREKYPGTCDGDDTLYDKAMRLLLTAHRGQKDKAGKDYRLHPLRVSESVSGTRTRMVALLHDLLEDTPYTFNDLKEMSFPQEVIDGILSVTREDGETYRDFVKRARSNYSADR